MGDVNELWPFICFFFTLSTFDVFVIQNSLSEVQLSGTLYQALPSDEVYEPSAELLENKTVDDANILSFWKQQFVDAIMVFLLFKFILVLDVWLYFIRHSIWKFI